MELLMSLISQCCLTVLCDIEHQSQEPPQLNGGRSQNFQRLVFELEQPLNILFLFPQNCPFCHSDWMAILILQFSKILENVKKRKEEGVDLAQQGMTSLACITSKVRSPVPEKKKSNRQNKQTNKNLLLKNIECFELWLIRVCPEVLLFFTNTLRDLFGEAFCQCNAVAHQTPGTCYLVGTAPALCLSLHQGSIINTTQLHWKFHLSVENNHINRSLLYNLMGITRKRFLGNVIKAS